MMKRVIIFKNGIDIDGKVVLVSDTIEEFLLQAGEKLNLVAKKIYSRLGGEIDDISLIRDDEKLYISSGEPFIDPNHNKLTISRNNDDRPENWLTLNVGGKYFTTSKSTLVEREPNSMLARMFAVNENGYLLTPSDIDSRGAYLIDRSPTYFECILNYLRTGQMIYDKNVNPEGILKEAIYFRIESIIPDLEDIVQAKQKEDERRRRRLSDDVPLTREDIVRALIMTPYNNKLRFQGVNLSGADLSRLDLRNINFKYACMADCKLIGTNMSWCCLERADLSNTNCEGAQFLGVKGLCANLEGANLKGCNFEDPAGARTHMEGVNLKGAVLEGSNMTGVNLRVATLKNANLRNCDLRSAVLAGADLECCDLSGSDLHEANLRGANLLNASFELMLTPLHMAQAIP